MDLSWEKLQIAYVVLEGALELYLVDLVLPGRLRRGIQSAHDAAFLVRPETDLHGLPDWAYMEAMNLAHSHVHPDCTPPFPEAVEAAAAEDDLPQAGADIRAKLEALSSAPDADLEELNYWCSQARRAGLEIPVDVEAEVLDRTARLDRFWGGGGWLRE